MKNLAFILLSFLLILLSCENHQAESRPNRQPASLATYPFVETMSKLAIHYDTSKVERDTIFIPDYRIDTMNMGYLLQEGGTYHGEEVAPDAQNKKWLGLFKSRKGYYIGSTDVGILHEYDGIIDQDTNSKTGITVKVHHKDTSIMLFSGIDFLAEKKVNCLIGHQDFPHPGDDTIRFEFKGNNYKLYACGIPKYDDINPGHPSYYNYKLYLNAINNGKEITQILRATDILEYEAIIFIGDLDGDDIPDMIFDLARENSSIQTLYLSKPAKPGKLLEIVTTWGTTGC